jgi:hypothetical protein
MPRSGRCAGVRPSRFQGKHEYSDQRQCHDLLLYLHPLNMFLSGLVTLNLGARCKSVTKPPCTIPSPSLGLPSALGDLWMRFLGRVFLNCCRKDPHTEICFRYLQNCQPDPGCQDRRRRYWRIGEGGIVREDIMIIGAIHVSAGSWMPILQLNCYILSRIL